MTDLNRHQPDRPFMMDNVHLNYSTLPVIGDPFLITTPYSMIAQCRIYRAVCRGEIPNNAAVAEIYDFLFDGKDVGLSKKTMGSIIVRSVRYNPRVLLGVSKQNEKARVIYSFSHMAELQFGLEWMICSWLRKFLNDHVVLKDDMVSGPERMSEELDILANSDEREYRDLYETPLWAFKMEEPDWSTLAKDLKERPWGMEEPTAKSAPKSYR
jgi:hypothetical protein